MNLNSLLFLTGLPLLLPKAGTPEIPAVPAWKEASTDKLKKLLLRAGPLAPLFVSTAQWFDPSYPEDFSLVCGWVEYRHRLEENYKVDILPLDEMEVTYESMGRKIPAGTRYSASSFYISDFVNLLRQGDSIRLTRYAMTLVAELEQEGWKAKEENLQ
jgi:hypothetical protein